jgi:hypothetical protein
VSSILTRGDVILFLRTEMICDWVIGEGRVGGGIHEFTV